MKNNIVSHDKIYCLSKLYIDIYIRFNLSLL